MLRKLKTWGLGISTAVAVVLFFAARFFRGLAHEHRKARRAVERELEAQKALRQQEREIAAARGVVQRESAEIKKDAKERERADDRPEFFGDPRLRNRD